MGRSLLSIERVSKGYSRGTQWTEVLKDVSLRVEPGEIVAVTGSRLEGKTTLLKIAAGMERSDEGSVSLGELALTSCRDRERSKLLGRQIVWIDREGPGLNYGVLRFVGQPLTLHGSKERRANQAAAQALEQVGAQKCLGRLWGDLSNWQRILVGLARAFACSPQIVIIDDLLDALGEPGTEEAADLLRSLMEASEPRPGVLMSASDIESAMYADRVFSITAKRSLTQTAGQHADGKVLPFPDIDSPRAGGSLGVGST
jgi:predicted ABC-type transport system involved in lysophospholipase L1 biosynthesis ATPase subunit